MPRCFRSASNAATGLSRVKGVFGVFRQVRMLVPSRVVCVVAVVDLNEPHASFRKSSGHQALLPIAVGALLANAVHLFDVIGLL